MSVANKLYVGGVHVQRLITFTKTRSKNDYEFLKSNFCLP